jgi:hypothetical protein
VRQLTCSTIAGATSTASLHQMGIGMWPDGMVADGLLLWLSAHTVQVAARRFKTPHHYKALGLAMGATEADIRK